MSLSELQVLTDIANRGDFYNERDEFNTIMKLNEEIDSSIEDLYALYDIVDSGKDLASLENFVGQDLKRLTGKSEVSMEGLSMLVVVGIVALLGAIIALLIWVIRSFSKAGSAVANTANNVNKLIDDAKKGVSNLKPPQPIVEAIDEVIKDLNKHIEESHNLQDEEEKRLQNLANKADEMTKFVEEMVSEAKQEQVPIEIDPEDCPSETPEEKKDDFDEWLKRAQQVRDEAKKNLSEEVRGVLATNQMDYKNTIRESVSESEKELHALFKELKSEAEGELPLFGEDYIIDGVAIEEAFKRMANLLPILRANLKSVGVVVRNVETLTDISFKTTGDIFSEILKYTEAEKYADQRKYRTLNEYAQACEDAIKTGDVSAFDNAPSDVQTSMKAHVRRLNILTTSIKKEFGSTTENFLNSFDNAINVPVECVKSVNELIFNAKRVYLKDIYQKVVDNAYELLRKELPEMMKNYTNREDFDKYTPYFYQDVYTKIVDKLAFLALSGYRTQLIDMDQITSEAGSLNIDTKRLSEKMNGHVDRYKNLGENDSLNVAYKKVIIPLMKPFLDIVAQCKSVVSASVDAVTVLQKMHASIDNGAGKAQKALFNAVNAAGSKANNSLHTLVLAVAGQLTKWYVAPPQNE